MRVLCFPEVREGILDRGRMSNIRKLVCRGSHVFGCPSRLGESLGETMRPYTFYVDESGDVGTDRVRSAENSGASPYMTLGGALVGVDHQDALRGVLSELSQRIKPESLHCYKLDHFRKCSLLVRSVGSPSQALG